MIFCLFKVIGMLVRRFYEQSLDTHMTDTYQNTHSCRHKIKASHIPLPGGHASKLQPRGSQKTLIICSISCS